MADPVVEEVAQDEVEEGEVVAEPSQPVEDSPLQFSWTLWYNPPNRHVPGTAWKSNVRKVINFDTVQGFWRAFNQLPAPQRLLPGSDVHIFKTGVQEPSWEDPYNKRGGKWVASYSRRDPPEAYDSAWLKAVLAMIGEEFSHSDEICGLVLSPRLKASRLSLWTRTAQDEIAQLKLGDTFKELTGRGQIAYQMHQDAMKSNHSFKNTPKYVRG